MVSIIAAMDSKRGIGKDNKIPWHIVEDLVHLKSLTKDQVVILGRKTYESMVWYYDRSGRPMPGKLYIVVTRDNVYKPTRENTTVAHSLEEALQKSNGEDVFINGGAQIFEQAMPFVDKLYLTIVEARLDSPPESPARQGDFGADTFFPDYSGFKKIHEEEHDNGKYKFKFVDLLKS